MDEVEVEVTPELGLISAVLRTKDMLTPMKEGITKKVFTSYPVQWEFIEDYYAVHRRPPSRRLFLSKFNGFRMVQVDDVDYFVAEVKEDHARQRMIEIFKDQADDLRGSGKSLEVASRYATALMDLQSELAGRDHEINLVEDWETIYKEVSARMKRRDESKSGLPGIPSGFPAVDKNTGGMHPGEYWVVAARLGQGKTWTGIKMASVALFAGYRVQYHALEQSKTQIAMRMHSFMSSEVGAKTFRSMDLSQGHNFSLIEYKKWLRTLDKHITGQMFISDLAGGSLSASQIGAQIQQNSPDIVFVDYITLLNREDGYEGVQKLSREIKLLCQQHNVPIVVMAQINRMGINQNKQPPKTEHLSGSDAIGQDADGIITLAKQSESVMKLRMAKYRHGMDGYQWYARFTPNTGHYEEVSGDKALELQDLDAARDDLV